MEVLLATAHLISLGKITFYMEVYMLPNIRATFSVSSLISHDLNKIIAIHLRYTKYFLHLYSLPGIIIVNTQAMASSCKMLSNSITTFYLSNVAHLFEFNPLLRVLQPKFYTVSTHSILLRLYKYARVAPG